MLASRAITWLWKRKTDERDWIHIGLGQFKQNRKIEKANCKKKYNKDNNINIKFKEKGEDKNLSEELCYE